MSKKIQDPCTDAGTRPFGSSKKSIWVTSAPLCWPALAGTMQPVPGPSIQGLCGWRAVATGQRGRCCGCACSEFVRHRPPPTCSLTQRGWPRQAFRKRTSNTTPEPKLANASRSTTAFPLQLSQPAIAITSGKPAQIPSAIASCQSDSRPFNRQLAISCFVKVADFSFFRFCGFNVSLRDHFAPFFCSLSQPLPRCFLHLPFRTLSTGSSFRQARACSETVSRSR